jgi:hypothetical protein
VSDQTHRWVLARSPHKNSKPRIWQVEFQLHEFNTVHVAAASCFPTVEAQVDDRAIFLAFSGAVLEGGVRQIRVTNMRQSGVAASLMRNAFDQRPKTCSKIHNV